MGELDLKPFCSVDSTREYLWTPFSFGDFTYATDGHIAIRVPNREGEKGHPDAPAAKLATYFSRAKTLTVPLPPANLPPPPDAYIFPCENCDGTGKVDGYTCFPCDGDGEFYLGEKVTVQIGRANYAAKFIRLLYSLPNARVEPNPDPAGAIYFAFDGGDGLLVAYKKPEATHIVLGVAA